jgi:hypothetical protein
MTSVTEYQAPAEAGTALQPMPPDGGKRTVRSRMPALRTFLVTALILGGAGAGGT